MGRHSKPNASGFLTLIPEQLRMARIARGYTVTELSNLIDVSKQVLSNYENGKSKPSAEVFLKLKSTLGFPTSFFTNSMNTSEKESVTFFRSLKSTTKKSRSMQQIRIDFLESIFRYLNDYIDFPKVNLPTIDEHLLQNLTEDDIEEIATSVRRHWGLGNGPISDVTTLLEKNGIIIANITVGDGKVDAFSEMRCGRPFVILSNDKQSAVRSRLDGSHELGHLLMHTWIDEEEMDKNMLDRIEPQAQFFAGCFLLPRETFGNEIMSSSLDHFIELKKRWKVSIQAMAKRALDLGILSDNQYTYLQKQMAIKKLKTKEPLDNVLQIEEPSLLKQSINLLIEHKVKNPQDIVEDLNLPIEEIEQLCCLEPGVLSIQNNVLKLKLK